jgi:hypothetical protein
MKAILKQKKIDMFDIIKVDKELIGKVLCATDELHQEILQIDEQIILRETSREANDKYKSTTDIDVYLKEGDILVKLENGYTKPMMELIEVDTKLEKAINELNRKC